MKGPNLRQTLQKIVVLTFTVLIIVNPVESRAQSKSKKITSIGVVAPNRTVILSAKIMGRIIKLAHDEGEYVEEGEALVTLDNTELMAELASANAALGLARAEHAHKEKQAQRREKLFNEKSISEDAVENALLAAAVAAEKEKIAETTVLKVKTTLKETLILAPFDAIVIAKKCEIGQVTQPGSPLCVIEDHSKLKFRTKVKERDIAHISKGQKAKVTIDVFGKKRFTGKVSKIIPSGDTSTHMFTVEVELPPIKGLYVGMFGKAFF